MPWILLQQKIQLQLIIQLVHALIENLLQTEALKRVQTTPFGAETTSAYWYENINGCAYWMSTVQHPYGKNKSGSCEEFGTTLLNICWGQMSTQTAPYLPIPIHCDCPWVLDWTDLLVIRWVPSSFAESTSVSFNFKEVAVPAKQDEMYRRQLVLHKLGAARVCLLQDFNFN